MWGGEVGERSTATGRAESRAWAKTGSLLPAWFVCFVNAFILFHTKKHDTEDLFDIVELTSHVVPRLDGLAKAADLHAFKHE